MQNVIIASAEEAHACMRKYSSSIPEHYYDLLEDVLLGLRSSVEIPQSDVDKIESDPDKRTGLNS
jgi:hypothetical protein